MSQHIITDLTQLKDLAEQHHDEFEVMRYTLELRDDLSDEFIDSWVDEIAAPIIEAIDCRQCANCCRNLEVTLTKQDFTRLGNTVDIPLDVLTNPTITPTEGDWATFRQSPCIFLDDNRCSIYKDRPESCRIYPLFTPDFRWTLKHTIEGAKICPIIYNVLMKLVEEVDHL